MIIMGCLHRPSLSSSTKSTLAMTSAKILMCVLATVLIFNPSFVASNPGFKSEGFAAKLISGNNNNNNAPDGSSSSSLLSPTNPEVMGENKDALEGDTIRLTCRYNPSLSRNRLGSKELVYYWQKTSLKGQDVAAINSNSLVEDYVLESVVSEGKYDLIISSAQYDRDNGFFECKIKEAGSGIEIQSTAYTLTILIPPGAPRITTSTSVAKEGEDFHLICSSEGGSPDPVIQWFKDNVPLQGNMKRGGTRDKPTQNDLVIRPNINDDRSVYRCTVWNRAIREDQKLSSSYGLTVHYVPRVKVGPFNPLNVMKGNDAFMACTVDANPPVTKIRWFKNNRLISHESNHTVVNVVPSDSGSFVCVADNGVTDVNGNAGRGELELSVQFGPVVTVIPEKEVVSGESINIQCTINSNPKPHTVIWTKENDKQFRQSGDILTLDRISPDDSGKYICTASNSIKPSGSLNSLEETSSASVNMRVLHKPGDTHILPHEPIAISGRPFSLSCGSSPPGWPKPEFRWWKEGNEQKDLSRLSNLTFQVMHVSQEGRYYCQPYNLLGKGSIQSVYLTVNEPPSVTLPMPPTLIRKSSDKSFSITCRARGKPKPSVIWTHDGIAIGPENGLYRIETRESIEDVNVYVLQSQLHFESLSKNAISGSALESGKYGCLFENHIIGSPAKAETQVRVEHSPIVRHTNNKVAFDVGENATLQCKMSAYPEPKFEWSFQGKLIDGFHSRRYHTNVTDVGSDIHVGSLFIRETRPEDYGDYLCRSWNSVGDDDEKTIIMLVKKSAPDAPSHIEPIEILSDSLTLRWKESFNGGYANTEYVIAYSSDGDSWRNESCRSLNPCRVTGLKSRSDYMFRVMAVNVGGHSPFSEEITVTTKVDLKDMPTASDAYFDSVRNSLSFRVETTNLRLVAKIEVRETGTSGHQVSSTSDWTPLTVVPIISDYEEILLKPSLSSYSDIRIVLCLHSNDSWCGYEHLVKMDSSLSGSTYLRESRGGYSLEQFMFIIVVTSLLAVCGIFLFICCCCYRSKDDGTKGSNNLNSEPSKKKKSSTGSSKNSSNTSSETNTDPHHPKGVNSISPPFYATHENKVLMNGEANGLLSSHDSNHVGMSLPLYGTSAGSMNGGHLQPLAQNYYLTGDGMNDPTPSGSNDTTQSDLWMMKDHVSQNQMHLMTPHEASSIHNMNGVVMNDHMSGYPGPSASYHNPYDQQNGMNHTAYSYQYYPHEEYQMTTGGPDETTLNLKNTLYSPYGYDDGPVVYGSTPMNVIISDNISEHHPMDASNMYHDDDDYSSNTQQRQASTSNGRVVREIIV